MSHAKQLHNRRYLDDYMEIINRKGLPGTVKSALCHEVQNAVVATTQHVIEQALEAELSAYLGAERYEHLPWWVLFQRPLPEPTHERFRLTWLSSDLFRVQLERWPVLLRRSAACVPHRP